MIYFEHYDKIVTEDDLQKAYMNEELLVEMANLETTSTGLPYKLWIDQAGSRRDVSHNNTARLKVQVNGDWIPMTIEDNPDIPKSVKNKTGIHSFPKIQKIQEWIKAYKPILEAHFFGKITDETAINLLKTLELADASKVTLDQIIENKREIVYYYDYDEILWFIEVIEADKSKQTFYVDEEYKLLYTISKLKDRFNIDIVREIKR